MNSDRKKQPSKMALVLAGGGIAGAVYEMGALRAIDDLLVDRTVNDFDIYVGTSAGALVSSALVNGLTPQEMLQSVEGTHPLLPTVQRRDLFRLNARSTFDRLWRLPGVLRSMFEHYSANPHDLNLIDLLWELSNVLPAAIYDSMALEAYMRRMLRNTAATNHFHRLQKELYIIATSLGSGRRVVFGDEPFRNVPISLAVAASSAVPVVYNPVRIGNDDYVDGGIRGNASLDVAIEKGAKLVVCVNPLVPYDSTADSLDASIEYLSDKGMQVVIDQMLRILLHSGLHYHVKQLRRRHPDVDIILIEPRHNDQRMMFANVMRYSTRLAIAQHGYESVTSELAEDYFYFKATLARHGVEISRRNVVPRLQQLREAGDDTRAVASVFEVPDRPSQPGTLSSLLSSTLSSLETLLWPQPHPPANGSAKSA